MRKRWLFVPVLVGALAFGLTGLAFLPQVDEEKSESRFGDYAARVAFILGLETATVQDAMEQAKQELAAEGFRKSWTQWWQAARSPRRRRTNTRLG